MKRSFRALLAITATTAATFGLTTTSIAASFGSADEEVITGVYAQQLEATRSCSIDARGINEDLGLGPNYQARGTTVRLVRKSGSDDATGKVKIEFDATGANAVYFENFGVGSFDDNISDLNTKAKGSISVKLVEAGGVSASQLDPGVQDQILTAIKADVSELAPGKLLASISGSEGNNQSKAGLVVGGQDDGKGISNRQIKQLENINGLGSIFRRPTQRMATVDLKINDISKLRNPNAVIQARLVCAPLIYDQDGSGQITPIN